ncbi:MAG: CotH kinase family protein, partial [Planctomycetota bacterium]
MILRLLLSSVFILLLVFSQIANANQNRKLTAEKIFDPARVIEVDIEVSESDWDKIRMQGREFVEAFSKQPPQKPFKYVKANVTIDGVKIENVGLRKKGFLGSLDENRPSLKIKFSEYQQQAPIEGLDRLTLNNNKQDPAGLSQYLTYRLFNESGTFASRCNLSRVMVNGQYLGIYSNVESVKPLMLKRGFKDGSGRLYEGTVADFYPDFVEKFEKKDDDFDFEPIKSVAAVLAEEELNPEELGKLVDIDAFMTFWAVESLVGFWDGYTHNQNNFFVYQNPTNSLLYFIPWGADSTFTDRMPLPPFIIRPRFVHTKSLLANRLYQ